MLRGFLDAGMRVAFSSYFRNQNRVVYGDDREFMTGLRRDLADGVRRYLSVADMTDDDYFAFFAETHLQYHTDASGKIRVLLSPSNVQWNSDEFLQRTKEQAVRYQTGIHMHLVESTIRRTTASALGARRRWSTCKTWSFWGRSFPAPTPFG